MSKGELNRAMTPTLAGALLHAVAQLRVDGLHAGDGVIPDLRRNLVKLAYAYSQNSRHRVIREGSWILIRRNLSRIDRRADGYLARVIRRSGESPAIGMQEPETPAEFNYFKKELRVNRDGNVRSRNRQFFPKSGQ
jgi:hypothetical protein